MAPGTHAGIHSDSDLATKGPSTKDTGRGRARGKDQTPPLDNWRQLAAMAVWSGSGRGLAIQQTLWSINNE